MNRRLMLNLTGEDNMKPLFFCYYQPSRSDLSNYDGEEVASENEFFNKYILYVDQLLSATNQSITYRREIAPHYNTSNGNTSGSLIVADTTFTMPVKDGSSTKGSYFDGEEVTTSQTFDIFARFGYDNSASSVYYRFYFLKDGRVIYMNRTYSSGNYYTFTTVYTPS